MKLEQNISWLSEKDFINGTLAATILDLKKEEKELILYVRCSIEEKKFSLWGKNYNFLYNVLGSDSDTWKGKTIILKAQIVNGKVHKTIIEAK